MSKIWLMILVLAVNNLFSQQLKQIRLKVMTLNIRYDNPDDGANAWPQRRSIVVQTINQQQLDVFGLQEAQFHQLTFLDSVLSDYHYYGIGRDDGGVKGEFSPIFYKKERFILRLAQTFWLSENPEMPGSIGPGAQFPRILTLIQLYDLKTQSPIWVANTHFSHVSDTARSLAASVLMNKLRQYISEQPLILIGDFNAEQNSRVYKIFVSDSEIKLKDTFFASIDGHAGGHQTYNGFGQNQNPTIIDHIFCNDHFDVLKHYFLPIKKGDVFISDHFPVVAELRLKDK
ncbi:MAG: endonuclease/exonuclease/phosphatase family protein [Caldisericaceae bacterium]|nr:endonuclease/exonuclease/phosphatase family protein [Caldisericaceae bacterium]